LGVVGEAGDGFLLGWEFGGQDGVEDGGDFGVVWGDGGAGLDVFYLGEVVLSRGQEILYVLERW